MSEKELSVIRPPEAAGTALLEPATASRPAAESAPATRSAARRTWPMLVAVLGVALAAGGLLLVDQAVTDRLTAWEGWLTRPVQALLGLSGFLVLLAVLGSYPNGRNLGIGFVTAMLLSTALTHLLKVLVGRGRPQLHQGPYAFTPFSGHGNFESFPSGHSSAAAALAVLLGMYFPRARWLFYFLAGVIGFERVLADKHYLTDVLAGFAIGALAVWATVQVLGRRFFEREWPARSAGAG